MQKLELINYLKQLGFSIKQIKQLLNDHNGSESLLLLFKQQLTENEIQIAAFEEQQQELKSLTKTIATHRIAADELTDIAKIMNKESRLTSLRRKMWLFGFSILLIEVVGIVSAYQFKQNNFLSAMWLSIAMMLVLVLGLTATLTKYYYDQVEHLCPNCGNKFVPNLTTFIFSAHTPKFRRLVCPNCHQKSYCLEIAR
ncbi:MULTISPECIES: MerR family DNA-binding protein [Lactobacillus]|uniref:MerR family DNA-binding protein n=1 Tax=Lactobacillus TaxID=1578 RepID=UPI002711D3FC|nr:MerR family DNA-binding protein [Lactobacillus sp. HT06-2]